MLNNFSLKHTNFTRLTNILKQYYLFIICTYNIYLSIYIIYMLQVLYLYIFYKII